MENLKSVGEIQRAIEHLFSKISHVRLINYDLAKDSKILIIKNLIIADYVLIPAMSPEISTFFQSIKIKEISNVKFIILSLGHGSRLGWYYYLWGIDKFISSRDIFIASCKAEQSLLQKSFSNITVKNLPYPIICSPQKHVNIPGRPYVLIYSGRINRQKNIHTLIHAFYILTKKDFNLSLEIYGTFDDNTITMLGVDGYDYLKFLNNLISKLGLEEKIHIHPFLKEDAIIHKHKAFNLIYISPSLNLDENFGIGPLIYLANNIPCVLSNWGGFKEHKKYFQKLAFLVNVHKSTIGGPYIKPSELSKKIANIIYSYSSFSTQSGAKSYFDNVTSQWIQLINTCKTEISRNLAIAPIGDLKKMLEIQESKNVQNRIETHSPKTFSKKIFNDWNDDLLQTVLVAYGMRITKTNCKKNHRPYIENYFPEFANQYIDAHKGQIVPEELHKLASRKSVKAGVYFEH